MRILHIINLDVFLDWLKNYVANSQLTTATLPSLLFYKFKYLKIVVLETQDIMQIIWDVIKFNHEENVKL